MSEEQKRKLKANLRNLNHNPNQGEQNMAKKNTPVQPTNVEIVSQENNELLAEIERIKAENAALKAGLARRHQLSMKVSEKGGVSVYGLGRFPVTLYGEQWEKLLDFSDTIRKFLVDNAKHLSHKE